MPPKFFGSELNEEAPDMWLPITAQPEVMLQPSLLNPHGLFWIHLMARLRDGVSPEQSQAWATTKLQQFMMAREGAQVSEKRQKEIGQIRIDMLPGGRGVSHLRAQFEQPLLILMGVVGLVLAIACANLANFLLSKSASRGREFSTRLALGASHGRIARQILTEALILSGIGGLLGLAVAFWGTHVLVAFVVAGAKHKEKAHAQYKRYAMPVPRSPCRLSHIGRAPRAVQTAPRLQFPTSMPFVLRREGLRAG